MTKYLFGKSTAAIALEKLVENDSYIRAKVMKHISEYNRYVDEVSKIKDKKVMVKALMYAPLDCDLEVSKEIKQFIRNVKIAKRRRTLEMEAWPSQA